MTKIEDSPVSNSDSVTLNRLTDLERIGDQSIVTYTSSDIESFQFGGRHNGQDGSNSGHEPDEHHNGEHHNSVEGQAEVDVLLGSQAVPQTGVQPNQSRSKSRSTSRSKNKSLGARLLASSVLILSIAGLSALGGFLVGQGQAGTTALNTFSGAGAPPKSLDKVDVADAQSAVAKTEMTNQLGELRAELLRLHSVFVHLAKLAELDEGEFDLESPLLEWKEQTSVEKLGLLNRRIAHISHSSSTLTKIFDTRRIAYDHKISGRPIAEGHKSSGFGFRTDPLNGTKTEHLGQDYSGPVGEPILALADGVVTFSGKNSGYGNLVELEHIDGFKTRYAHNHVNLVDRGTWVKKGEVIATLGSTGRSTGPHVHVEVRLDGEAIDPSYFLR